MKPATLLLCVLLLCCGAAASSSVPPMISYQGKLMQPSGAPVPDGTYSITFAIYDVPTGGSPLWSETNPSVAVKGGLFSVLLGSVVNLPANIFDNPDRFFAVKVASDPEMTPRQQIASVGYAIRARSADNGIPVGGIIMWSGAVAGIPQGWRLCDGTNGTPDLRNRFVVGAGNEYGVAATGGEKLHQLTVAEMPGHTHIQNPHNHTFNGYGIYPNPSYSQPPGTNAPLGNGFLTGSTTATNQNTGGDQPHENRPPYYALCFIMKVGS